MQKITLLLLFSILFGGCDLFTTRTPEEPDSGRSSFRPPTSAQIVLDNFIAAVQEANSENYLQCISDSTEGILRFYYIPSNQAISQYPELFTTWDRMSEYRFFSTIAGNLKENKFPELIFANGGFDIQLPDSAVYITDYFLTIPHTFQSIPSEYSGSLQFTLMPDFNRLWSITKWMDVSSSTDTSSYSWSLLKAALQN